MIFIFEKIWVYRTEILLAIQLLSKLRKTAQQITREYIRRKVATKLRESLAIVGTQIGLFILAAILNDVYPSLFARMVASAVLWAVTIYNVTCFFLLTVPELRALHRTLSGKAGYTIRYMLEVSLVTELLRLNIVFLVFCLIAGVSTRTAIGTTFSYTKPWAQAFRTAPAPHYRRRRG